MRPFQQGLSKPRNRRRTPEAAALYLALAKAELTRARRPPNRLRERLRSRSTLVRATIDKL